MNLSSNKTLNLEGYDIIDLIKEFNSLMNSAITGPNCIDKDVCRGDCCSIEIDIPKVLAKRYIEEKLSHKDDFIRSNIFSFKLRFDYKKRKCFLFDYSINGCTVHKTGIKPPQCWIYPTQFLMGDKKTINCKRASGWKIIDEDKSRKAEFLLQIYNKLCENEAKREIESVNDRIGDPDSKKRFELINNTKTIPPSKLVGFKDTWDHFEIFTTEGYSLQLKNFCNQFCPECSPNINYFLNCKKICDKIATNLINFLSLNINRFIKKEGPDSEGQYPLFKLFKLISN